MKSHSPRRMTQGFGRKSNGNKAKINAINFKNLEGWEGEEGTL